MSNIFVPKVSGGAEALPNEFPWQAYLKIEYDNLQVEQCGGVLVDNDVVLTAAHCVKGVNILHRVFWGVLVDNDVVLTAAHCVTGVNILHRVFWGGSGGQ